MNLQNINLTNRNRITNDNSSDSDYLSNRNPNKREFSIQMYQFTNEAIQSNQRNSLFTIKHHQMSLNSIHMQLMKLINVILPSKHCFHALKKYKIVGSNIEE